MASYLFLYRGEPWDPSQVSPEDMQKTMEAWMAWINEGMAAGWMLEPGDALGPGGKVVHTDKSVTDGPFTESKEIVGGYSIVKADSYEEALQYAMSCPDLDHGGKVEIREFANIMENMQN